MSIENQSILLQNIADASSRVKVFESLVDENQEKLYFFIRRMVLDHDDANDVIQNTFVKAWNALPKFRGESKLSSWLFRIAHNESINFLNKKKRIMGVDIEKVQNSLQDSLIADVHYDGDEIQAELQSAIATLPPKQKSVFIMKYYEEKKYTEIAEITGSSVGSLKASYFHAVQKIEKIINPD